MTTPTQTELDVAIQQIAELQAAMDRVRALRDDWTEYALADGDYWLGNLVKDLTEAIEG